MGEKIRITKRQVENPCEGCGSGRSVCCTYIQLAVPMEFVDDDNIVDFDSLVWYLTRPDMRVIARKKPDGAFSIEKDYWAVFILQDCKYLLPNGLCSTYESRPHVCADYASLPTKEYVVPCERYQVENDRNADDFLYMVKTDQEIVFDNKDKLEVFLNELFGYEYKSRRPTLIPDLDRLEITD